MARADGTDARHVDRETDVDIMQCLQVGGTRTSHDDDVGQRYKEEEYMDGGHGASNVDHDCLAVLFEIPDAITACALELRQTAMRERSRPMIRIGQRVSAELRWYLCCRHGGGRCNDN